MNRNKATITIMLMLGAFISGTLPAHGGEQAILLIAQEHTGGKVNPSAKEVCPVSGEEIGKETNITYEYMSCCYRH